MVLAQAQAVDNKIDITGSTEVACEYLNFAINSILFQRCIYDPKEFKRTQRYNMNLHVTTNPCLADYLNQILHRMRMWLKQGQVDEVTLVVLDKNKTEALERWTFKIKTNQASLESNGEAKKVKYNEKKIKSDIRRILLQITSLNGLLPSLQGECAIDFEVLTTGVDVTPEGWGDTEQKLIDNGVDSSFGKIDTKIHHIESGVTFKPEDEDYDF